MSYNPIIVLSNAHQRTNPGAVNQKINLSEYVYSVEINRRIHNLFVTNDDIEEDVYIIDSSWSTSYKESLREKVRIINGIRPKLCIENHLNAHSNPAAQGCETLYMKDSIPGAKIAQILQSRLCAIKEIKVDRGTKERTDVMFLRATTSPAVITEPLFLSHSSSILLLNEKFLDQISNAIYLGICDYLED